MDMMKMAHFDELPPVSDELKGMENKYERFLAGFNDFG